MFWFLLFLLLLLAWAFSKDERTLKRNVKYVLLGLLVLIASAIGALVILVITS